MDRDAPPRADRKVGTPRPGSVDEDRAQRDQLHAIIIDTGLHVEFATRTGSSPRINTRSTAVSTSGSRFRGRCGVTPRGVSASTAVLSHNATETVNAQVSWGSTAHSSRLSSSVEQPPSRGYASPSACSIIPQST